MVPIMALWLPILVSAIVVWIVSALVWMVMPHHKPDFKKFNDEDAIREAINAQKPEPGMYVVPYAMDAKDAESDEIKKKFEDGPNMVINMMSNGFPNMGPRVLQSLILYLVIGVFAAYLAGRTLGPEASYLEVFRVVGVFCWAAHSFALVPQSTWFGKPWGSTVKDFIDGLVYALLTAGIFGWLWP